MLADIQEQKKKHIQQTALHTVRSSSTLKLATILGILMQENAKLLAEVNRLRTDAGQEQIKGFTL
jgi:hypothetical protein